MAKRYTGPPRKTSPRLKRFSYHTPGAYFVTVCTHLRDCILGSIDGGILIPSSFGKIVTETWERLPIIYPGTKLDQFTLMPNHIHAVLFLTEELSPKHNLSKIMRGFKTWSARKINETRESKGSPVWQRSFYDRIIRDEQELQQIRAYIINNPLKWELDRENPKFSVGTG